MDGFDKPVSMTPQQLLTTSRKVDRMSKVPLPAWVARLNSEEARMANQVTFTCGHNAPEPSNMGRGAARAKRLAVYSNRVCLDCAKVRLTAWHNTLTDSKGVLIPQTASSLQKLDERIAKLARTY